MVSFSSLPIDVLLHIFRDLDPSNVARTELTCKDLHQVMQGRRFWADQLDKLRQQDPALGPATSPLTSLSAQEIRTFVVNWIKLHHRWDNRSGAGSSFAAKDLVGIPGVCNLMLLPGGKSIVAIDRRGGIALYRINMADRRVSLSIVANIKSDQGMLFGPGRNKLLTTMLPCPILVHGQGNNIQIVKIDHFNDAMNLETIFRLPEGCGLIKADGRGRVIGFLVQRSAQLPRVIVIHLDHPGVTVESGILPTPALEVGGQYRWSVSIPAENLVVTNNIEHIQACKIPNFSTLSPGTNLMSVTQTFSCPGVDHPSRRLRVSLSSMTSEALFDPLSAPQFNLYYLSMFSEVTTVTVPIDFSDNAIDFASRPDEPPILEYRTTIIQGNANGRETSFSHRGLHFIRACDATGVRFLVRPLKNIASQDQRKVLQMFVSYQELGQVPDTTEIDMDEATGRVVIWGWNMQAQETRVLIGNLV